MNRARKASNNDFLKTLAGLKPPVLKRVRACLPRRFPQKHYRIVADYPGRQGKYFRPALTLLAAGLFGGVRGRQKALDVAAAMQLSEEWLLAHDDMLDHSKLRRGRPTLNALHGPEMAVNAGDALHVLMWQALGHAVRRLDPGAGWKIYDKMADMLLRTLEGQYLELDWRRKRRLNVTEREYFLMAYRKSGYYSVTGPLQLGALAAGADAAAVRGIESWGRPFGLAFQLQDDLLGTLPSRSGKDSLGDITEGKRTLIFIHLMNNSPAAVRRRVAAIYLKDPANKTAAEKDYVCRMMERHGSIAYARAKARELAASAEKRFLRTAAARRAGSGSNADHAKKSLVDGMRFAAAREY